MQTLTLLTAAMLVMQAYTLPHIAPRINFLEQVVLFDGLAFQISNQQTVSVALQSFVFLRQINLDPLSSALSSALVAVGLEPGDKIFTAINRTQLFAAVPLSEDVLVNTDGCQLVLSDPVHGMALRNFSLCSNTLHLGTSLAATVQASNNRLFNATIFSPSSRFGVISDIDDTVKISNVLDTPKLLQATLFDDPQPVEGMPELYASLADTLDSPQFIYVSGSPFQLYPFLRNFIDTTYSASRGPILLQNFTLTSLSSILDFTASDGVFEYKSAMIDRIKGMYPDMKFLAIGDSTQKDPETYGEAFRKYGDFITCSWIRRVDGANNTVERFAAAFTDVPQERYRIFNDSEITSLQDIKIAEGEC